MADKDTKSSPATKANSLPTLARSSMQAFGSRHLVKLPLRPTGIWADCQTGGVTGTTAFFGLDQVRQAKHFSGCKRECRMRSYSSIWFCWLFLFLLCDGWSTGRVALPLLLWDLRWSASPRHREKKTEYTMNDTRWPTGHTTGNRIVSACYKTHKTSLVKSLPPFQPQPHHHYRRRIHCRLGRRLHFCFVTY